MAKLKKPCEHYAKHGHCAYGDDCRYSHPPGALDTSGVPKRPHPINDTLPVKRKCNKFCDTGECYHGFKCRYQHVVNPAVRPKTNATEADGWAKIDPAGSAGVLAIHATFPSYATVNSRVSDDLLFPAKMLVPGKAKMVVQEAAQEGKKVNSVAIAETLIRALNASNRLNEHWVSQSSRTRLTCRSSKTARASSRPSHR